MHSDVTVWRHQQFYNAKIQRFIHKKHTKIQKQPKLIINKQTHLFNTLMEHHLTAYTMTWLPWQPAVGTNKTCVQYCIIKPYQIFYMWHHFKLKFFIQSLFFLFFRKLRNRKWNYVNTHNYTHTQIGRDLFSIDQSINQSSKQVSK